MYLKFAAAFIIASWILPNGKVLDVGALHHIDFVLKSPQKFGLTVEDIKDCITFEEASARGINGITTFRDGIEAGAYERVMNKVLEKGFIRLRKVRSGKYSFIWYADVDQFNHKAKNLLSDWAYNILTEKNRDTGVMISTLKDEAPKSLTVSSLANIVESHELLQLTTLDEMQNLV